MSEEDKDFEFKFQPDALLDWRKYAVQHLNFSNELIKAHLSEHVSYTETVVHELYKLSVNSLIFRDYLDELQSVMTVDDADGSMRLLEEDIANVWKCLLSLSESKKFLKVASLSLEEH